MAGYCDFDIVVICLILLISLTDLPGYLQQSPVYS